MKYDFEIILSSDTRKRDFSEEIEGVTDVYVKLVSGEKYIASFFTYEKILSLKAEHRQNGTFLNGTYFWAKNMVIIDSLDKHTIRDVIHHLLDEGDFFFAFKRLSDPALES